MKTLCKFVMTPNTQMYYGVVGNKKAEQKRIAKIFPNLKCERRNNKYYYKNDYSEGYIEHNEIIDLGFDNFQLTFQFKVVKLIEKKVK